MKVWSQKLLLLAMALTSVSFASVTDLTHQGMRDVVKIARAISFISPRLEDQKVLEYATGIYRAAKKYKVEPSVLVSITQQETGFREGLPEGAAGERGICQIIKSWMKNPKFKAEFKNFKLKDFDKPAKSFMVQAWILSDLKVNGKSNGTLPYWSYYNANKFHNRFKYFLAVNKYVAVLKKHENQLTDRAIAAQDKPAEDKDMAFAEPVAVAENEMPADEITVPSPVTANPKLASVVPNQLVNVAREMKNAVVVASKSPSITVPTPVKVAAVEQPKAEEEITVPKPDSQGRIRWIPDALKKLQVQQSRVLAADQPRVISPAILRAAAELDVQGVFYERPMQD